MRKIGYIDEYGVYRKGEDKPQGWDINPTWKAHNHDMQRREFSADIVQPFKNGKPSAKFIKTHPEVAKEYWNQTTIDQTLREGMTE